MAELTRILSNGVIGSTVGQTCVAPISEMIQSKRHVSCVFHFPGFSSKPGSLKEK